MAKHYGRDTKIAYVEQIRAGKLTAIEAARELWGCINQRFIYG
jgi:hypothetical protein